MLMDMFFASAPIEQKLPHFHEFMLEVHDRLHRQRQDRRSGDPLGPLAADIAAESAALLRRVPCQQHRRCHTFGRLSRRCSISAWSW
jgi:hypothetical protein